MLDFQICRRNKWLKWKGFAYFAESLFQVVTLTGCTDDDGETLSYSIISGNTNSDFAVDSSGKITLSNGK